MSGVGEGVGEEEGVGEGVLVGVGVPVGVKAEKYSVQSWSGLGVALGEPIDKQLESFFSQV